MDKPGLLAEFERQLEAFDKYRTFIAKAQEKADKFRPEVVVKVVRDNTAKMEEVAAVLDPLVSQVQAVTAELAARRTDVEGGVDAARLGLEELELRREIGELDDDAFAAEGAGYREQIARADDALAEIDAELVSFRGVLDAWLERRPSAAVAAPEPEPEPETAFEAPEDDLLGGLDEDDEAPAAFGDEESFESDAFGGVTGRGEAVHLHRIELADDVSAVFDEGAAAEEDEVLEAAEAPADEGIAFGDDELSDLAQNDVARPPLAFDLSQRAVLVLGEGSDEEQIFSFVNDVISMGRGRDNVVQVKNDSKVSRYHCKLFSREGSYFVEDNKSANGTVVDGELVTEKRLLGGEEIIIGETLFRFRVNP